MRATALSGWIALRRMVPICVALALLGVKASHADGPADNDPSQVRPVPPPGMQVPDDVRNSLTTRAAAIDQAMQTLAVDHLLEPLVTVFPRAVRMTLDTGMVYSERDLQSAERLLDEAERRLDVLRRDGDMNELLSLGGSDSDGPHLVASGFRSTLDNSIQPYGLVVPKDFQSDGLETAAAEPMRLDIWLHGRGERVSEVAFLQERMRDIGQYAPENTLVLHPYGRYSNAFKFAGEIDVLEAIAHVKQLFPVDDRRIVIRGFSMGGAGCWQLAVHYPDLWAAANPGAGFSESEFLRSFQQEEFQPQWFQQRLLHWYDCPDWTNNLRSVPTIAYSGEIDRQKQAADVMAASFAANGMHLPHVIGPQTAHKIHPQSKLEIEAWLNEQLREGKPVLSRQVDLTTYTLRYNQLAWVRITGLQQHWQRSRVRAELKENAITLTTENVASLELQLPKELQALASHERLEIHIDGQRLVAETWANGQSVLALARQPETGIWRVSNPSEKDDGLRKRPGLQGPIDDAFMDAFVFVPPDHAGTSLVDRWVQSEYEHATSHWQIQMRGDIQAVPPADVSTQLMQDRNLILFGTPETNSLIAKLIKALPLDWTQARLQIAGQPHDASRCVPILIYPNPLNPNRYVVLNSGFTYREYAYLNNARQIPVLPDWAVIHISQGATTQLPGQIQAAGFFDEQWQSSHHAPP